MRLGLYLLIQPGRVTGLDWGDWKLRTGHPLELDPLVLPVLFLLLCFLSFLDSCKMLSEIYLLLVVVGINYGLVGK